MTRSNQPNVDETDRRMGDKSPAWERRALNPVAGQT